MRTMVGCIIVLMCVAATSCQPAAQTERVEPVAPQQPTHTADGGAAVTAEDLAEIGLKYYWQMDADLDAGERIDHLVRLDENLYCLSDQNRLIAVNAMLGVRKWRHQICRADRLLFDPVHAADVAIPDEVVGIEGILEPNLIENVLPYDAVIINTMTFMMIIDRTTGRVVRDRHDMPLPFSASTAGSTDGVAFFVGSGSDYVNAVDLNSNVVAWETPTYSPLTVPPVYFSNHVYAGPQGNIFMSIQLTPSRKILWTQDLGGSVTAGFYAGAKGCFVPCEDMRIYAFDSFSGDDLWEQPFMTGGPCRTPIQVGDDTLFQYAQGDRLYAINVFTGEKRWDMPTGRMVLALMDGKAYVLDNENVLHIVDEMSGEVEGTLSMSSFDLFLPNTTAPAIFAAGRDGQLHCIRLLDAPRLTSQMLEAAPRPR